MSPCNARIYQCVYRIVIEVLTARQQITENLGAPDVTAMFLVAADDAPNLVAAVLLQLVVQYMCVVRRSVGKVVGTNGCRAFLVQITKMVVVVRVIIVI